MSPPLSRRALRHRGLWGLGAVLLLAGAALVWRGGGERGVESLRTAPVERGDLRVLVAASGNLAAVSMVEVGTQVSGQLIELTGDFNQRVSAGQVIARIDPQPFQGRVEQARADLASAQAALTSARAQQGEARQLQAQAERERQRRKTLQARGLIAAVELDASEVALEQAGARLQVTAAGIRSAEAGVAQRRAALENAEFDLARSEIRSPVDGVIIARNVERGQTVAASLQTPVLFSIAEDLTKMQIVLAIDEADVGQLSAGQPVRFGVDAFPARQFRGAVEQVRLAASNVANVITYPVVVAVDNADLSLLPGMTANAEIEISARRDVLRVPNAALRFSPAGAPPVARGGGGAPRTAIADELVERLQLDAAQQADLQARMAAGRGASGGAAGGRPDPAAAAERLEQVLDGLQPPLSALQRDALREWQEVRRQGRMATVYVLQGGEPQPRRVRIGISDGQYSELLAGPLVEGERLVTGYAAPPR
jgi:HlyD family secretion protein